MPEIKALPVVKDELQQMAKTLSPDLWQKGSRQKNAATFANEGLHKTGSTIGRAALSTLSQKNNNSLGITRSKIICNIFNGWPKCEPGHSNLDPTATATRGSPQQIHECNAVPLSVVRTLFGQPNPYGLCQPKWSWHCLCRAGTGSQSALLGCAFQRINGQQLT